MALVFTNGCFDLLHPGHIHTLEFAWMVSRHGPPRKNYGAWYSSFGSLFSESGKVIVGLNSDESIRFNKGPHRPVVPEEDRKAMLEAIKWVDEVIIFDEVTPYELIKEVKPTYIVKGGDYLGTKDIVGSDIAKVLLAKYEGNHSTSQMIGRIIALENKREEAARNR
jgi:D-beta-D-heptose 7-phosphate kinase/D-beta-D-heptose 1-phosphate adenosyltransferase